jgi:endonuclease/exonuclease/phosphatase family metal-dependent hydrolase
VNLSLFNLNLHGYHPMGAPRRYREDRNGRIRPAGVYPSGEPLFFFTTDELDHGNRRRLDLLAGDLHRQAPDVICLQEVAAGCPWTPRDRAIFSQEFPNDWFEANTALRLSRRLNALGNAYRPVLACRGNVGWVTSPGTFAEERVVTFSGTTPRVVFDFGDNPYPDGLLVEGLAVLLRPPWEPIGEWEWSLPINFKGDRLFAQAVAVRHGTAKGSPWFVVVNVHLGHKLANFEQAVALREALRPFRKGAGDWGDAAPEACLGAIISGDFNAFLYRPGDARGDVSMAAWEVQVPGHFDFRPESENFGDLLAALWVLNNDRQYKSWASIQDPSEARQRIEEAAVGLFKQGADVPVFREALTTAAGLNSKARRGLADLPCAESVPDRIDFVFAEPSLAVANACVVYPGNSWSSCAGTSDHPALFVEYNLEDC